MRVVGSRVGIDMDEVVADLHKPWVEWINQRFGVSIPYGVEDFRYWNWPGDTFGPEASDFLTPTIYNADIVKPISGTLAAVEAFRRAGHTPFFISHCPGVGDMRAAKRDWLLRHGFLRSDSESHRFIPASDKSKVPVHILIDDGVHNVRSFHGVGILVNAPHNRLEQWAGVRIDHLAEALPYLGF